jgi:hypothetical protein
MASLQEAMAEFLRGKGNKPAKDKTIEEEREVAKKISKIIPEPMFPHEALKKKKQRMDEMDKQTEE